MNSNIHKYLTQPHIQLNTLDTPPSTNLGLIITIPCYDEPDILPPLKALFNCQPPKADVEIFLAINAPANAEQSALDHNQKAYHQAQQFAKDHNRPGFNLHVLNFPNQRAHHAGAGLARKRAMDQAVDRFNQSGHPEGVIVSFDADTTCAKNYLSTIEQAFQQKPKASGCSIHFEHPLDQVTTAHLREGIVQYELYLRHYVLGLKWAGSPYAFHTIGSAFAVRAKDYAKVGGMNRRQAGEDFYFLQKLMRRHFFVLGATAVYPAPRFSHRVPFGTGAALTKWHQEQWSYYPGYDPQVYHLLKIFLGSTPQYDPQPHAEAFPVIITDFLKSRKGFEKIAQIRQQTASQATFLDRFHQWFNAFETMKFIHFASEYHTPRPPVIKATQKLLSWSTKTASLLQTSEDLLMMLRKKEQKEAFHPYG
ncbi:glycosyltransferase [Magnetococcales bacterium HHB-1]